MTYVERFIRLADRQQQRQSVAERARNLRIASRARLRRTRTACCSRSRNRASTALVALENAGLVEGARSGRERRWEIRAQRLAEATRYLEAISTPWDAAIERLRAFVERD